MQFPTNQEQALSPVKRLNLVTQQQEHISQQQEQITQQQEQIAKLQVLVEALQAEIRRLKKLPPKPDIKPNTKPKNDDKVQDIRRDFKTLTHVRVDFPDLQDALSGLVVIEKELLQVLDDPVLPLHNNLSESQIREYVKRRKISGGTKSKAGRKCRDTFASLKKTCRLHGLSFWHYLKDRIMGSGSFPWLPELIEQASSDFL